MLKEVGASGQISLGKKFAGQLYEVQTLESGEVRMLPVRVVPVSLKIPNNSAMPKTAKHTLDASDQEQWQTGNAQAIEDFNQRTKLIGSHAQRLHAWRDGQANLALASSTAFHQQFGAWVNEMNQMVEQHGVWSDGLMEAEQPHGTV